LQEKRVSVLPILDLKETVCVSYMWYSRLVIAQSYCLFWLVYMIMKMWVCHYDEGVRHVSYQEL